MKKVKLLVVELEPTHYKIDLWNAFYNSNFFEISVLFTEKKNWMPDGGHDYTRFPPAHFNYAVSDGKGVLGVLISTLDVIATFIKMRPNITYIAGYAHLQCIVAIIYSVFFNLEFVVFADVLNTAKPQGKYSIAKFLLRSIIRNIIFKWSKAVLVCGKLGVDAAYAEGCASIKTIDFPYVVSLDRIYSDTPDALPECCISDINNNTQIILFSGRMINRKGLLTLIKAVSLLPSEIQWVLWIEGAGPNLNEYILNVDRLGLSSKCRFLGFCQYDVHSWLVRSADIIVVPSLNDNWGIVVDEGLQLGKVVISTLATGSAVDRIENGFNGFIVSPNDPYELASCLSIMLNDYERMHLIGSNARLSTKNVRPQDNVRNFINFLGIK